MEAKVLRSLPVAGVAVCGGWQRFNHLFFVRQYSQMRDELFKSNMVCSFILSSLLMAVQVLIPAPRYAAAPACPSSSGTVVDWFCRTPRVCPMVAQFLAGGCVYALLLLLTLGEELKRCPPTLQSLCCWIHETEFARTLVTLAAIGVNFGIASADIVRRTRCCRRKSCAALGFLISPSFFSSLQLWCSAGLRNTSGEPWLAPPTSAWPAVNIRTHPEVSPRPKSPSVQTTRACACGTISALHCQQYMLLSGVVAMVTCAVFLRLSCVWKLVILLLAATLYTFLIETHR